MRVVNIADGSRHMTKVNAARHFLAMAKKLEANGTYEQKEQLIKLAMAEFSLNIVPCDSCSCLDFGYCGLRHSNISEPDKVNNYCFDAFVKQLKKIVNSNKHKNGRARVY